VNIMEQVIDWLRRSRYVDFVNARKIARRFGVDGKTAGHVLRKLTQQGYIMIYKRRRGRFNIYKVNKYLLRRCGAPKPSR